MSGQLSGRAHDPTVRFGTVDGASVATRRGCFSTTRSTADVETWLARPLVACTAVIL
jgi:hypothetical protein